MTDLSSERGRLVMQAIRDVLMQHWDPIGVSGIPEAPDEYDRYIGPVYRILAGTRSEEELVEFLFRSETRTMGLIPPSREALCEVARRLLRLEV